MTDFSNTFRRDPTEPLASGVVCPFWANPIFAQVLNRHQFLELLLRVADQRYVQTGLLLRSLESEVP